MIHLPDRSHRALLGTARAIIVCASVMLAGCRSILPTATDADVRDVPMSDVGTDPRDAASDAALLDAVVETDALLADSADARDAGAADGGSVDAGSDRALGAACTEGQQCRSGVCAADGRCSWACSSDASCFAPARCVPALDPARESGCVCSEPPTVETCNGLDDDCDFQIDEGATCPSGATCEGAAGCRCATGRTACGDSCTDLRTDHANCGACGHACDYHENCVSGECECSPPRTLCGSECVLLSNAIAHCGACGNACEPGVFCYDGICGCLTPRTLCGTQCVDLQTDTGSCGACGHYCHFSERCVDGTCRCEGPGRADCGGNCYAVDRDSFHCGDCSTTCATGTHCVDSACQCAPPRPDLCDAVCTSVAHDPTHCGDCSTRCATGAQCIDGVCTCPAEHATLCGDTCVDVQTDPRHCGACDNACAGVCNAGHCVSITSIGLGRTLWIALSDGSIREVRATSAAPASIAAIHDALQVVSGGSFDCVLRSDHHVGCWGSNFDGFLGDGTHNASVDPRPVRLDDVVQIVASDAHACARTTSGAIYCWGNNRDGRLGDGTTISRDIPTRVAIPPASDLAVGAEHTCAISDGSVWCWGAGGSGQIDGALGGHANPARVTLPTAASRVAAGYGGTCALGIDRQIYCWGLWRPGATSTSLLAPIATPAPVNDIAVGPFLYARLDDGRLLTWAPLGIEGPPPSTFPVRLADVVGVEIIATNASWPYATNDATCVLEVDQSLWCWRESFVHRVWP